MRICIITDYFFFTFPGKMKMTSVVDHTKFFFEGHKAETLQIMQRFEPSYEGVKTVLGTFDPQDLQGENKR